MPKAMEFAIQELENRLTVSALMTPTNKPTFAGTL
jgi:hypothetical protein